MGRHADAGRSRGVARWVFTAAVVVLVVAAVTVGYFVIVNRSDSASDAACTGSVTLPVAVGPDAAAAVAKAATAFNATKPVARSTCVTAAVTTVSDTAALAGLLGHWPTGAGSAPGLWVPDNAAALAALDASRPDLAAGHPTDPIAWSPVVLAVRSADLPALAGLSWSAIPTAAGPDGTAALPQGRHLLLALPAAGANPSTGYAVQSMLAAGRGSTPLDAASVRSDAGALDRIGRAAARSSATTGAALTALAAGTGPATAVPVVEATLALFDSGDAALSAAHPKGPTVGDALITAPITASWVDQTTAAAASAFQAYLTDAAGQQILADHGWRTAAAHPAHPVPGVDVTAAVTRFPAATPAVDAAISAGLGNPAAVTTGPTTAPPGSSGSSATSPTSGSTGSTATTSGAPSTRAATATTSTRTSPTTTPRTSSTTPANPAAKGPVLTVLVDSSSQMATDSNGKSLMAWVKKALPSVLGGSVTDRAGLWAFADTGALPPNGYATLVGTGPLTGKVGGHLRSTALTAAVDGLTAGGGRWAYGALIAALSKAPAAAVPGRQDRVVLITSGVDQTPATPRQAVLTAEAAAKGSVRVDVIGLGGAVPTDAYREIAQAGGGTYIPVTDPSQLGRALTGLLAPKG